MASGTEIHIFYITQRGKGLAERLRGLYRSARIRKFGNTAIADAWHRSAGLIFIMASGIVVRTIAQHLKDKNSDPAVVVLDERGRYAISLAGGHIGGANKIAGEMASFLKAEAVITTASDVSGMPAIDLWAKEHELTVENPRLIPRVGTKMLDKGMIRVCSNIGIDMPKQFRRVSEVADADMIITNKEMPALKGKLFLRPRNLVVGIGCNRNTPEKEIGSVVRGALKKNGLSFLSVRSIATIDIKADEPGLKAFAEKYSLPVRTFNKDELNRIENAERSLPVFRATGAYAVSEPAALLASGAGVLLVRKIKSGNVTVAVGEIAGTKENTKEVFAATFEHYSGHPPLRPLPSREGYCYDPLPQEARSDLGTLPLRGGRAGERVDANTITRTLIKPEKPEEKVMTSKKKKGMIYVVGTGPGGEGHITPQAKEAIMESDVIVGYDTYLDLIRGLIRDKETVSTGMTKEIDRCRKAIELASAGKTVSVISGGDPGIYAMAGLVFDLLKKEAPKKKIDVIVVPGISALNACASRLGAPLMHDFACISLSDRLTAWGLIEKRLDAAASADFVIVLYNPKSMGRPGHINTARDIIMRHRGKITPVGIVRAALRENEGIVITDLENMCDHEIDMQTTIIIGNSKTYVWNGRMVTPRGYEQKLN